MTDALSADLREISQCLYNNENIDTIYIGNDLIWSRLPMQLEMRSTNGNTYRYNLNSFVEHESLYNSLWFSNGDGTVYYPYSLDFNDTSCLTYVYDRQSNNGKGISCLANLDGCSNLSTIIMPNVTLVLYNACRNCIRLKHVSLPAVKYVGDSAFAGCSSLLSISLPAMIGVGSDAFAGCDSLLHFAADSISVLDSAFILPDSLTSFSGNSLISCHQLFSDGQQIRYVSMANLKYGEYTFWNCTNLSSVFMPSLETAGPYMFYGSAIDAVPNEIDIKSVGYNAFNTCHKIKHLNAYSLTDIGEYAFGRCSNLKYAYFKQLSSISRGAFSETNVENMTLDVSSLPNLGGIDAFDQDQIIYFTNENVYDQAATASNWKDIFYNIRLESAKGTGIKCKFNKYDTDFDVIYTAEKTGWGRVSCVNGSELAYPYYFAVTSAITGYRFEVSTDVSSLIGFEDVNTGITCVCDDCFNGCTNLTSIYVPNAISVGNNAFKNTNISSIDLQNATFVGNNAFSGTRLSCIDLPNAISVGTIDDIQLTRVSLPSVKHIDKFFLNASGTLSLDLRSVSSYESYPILMAQNITDLNIASLSDISYDFYLAEACPYSLTALNASSMSFEKFSQVSSMIADSYSNCSLTCSDGIHVVDIHPFG